MRESWALSNAAGTKFHGKCGVGLVCDPQSPRFARPKLKGAVVSQHQQFAVGTKGFSSNGVQIGKLTAVIAEGWSDR